MVTEGRIEEVGVTAAVVEDIICAFEGSPCSILERCTGGRRSVKQRKAARAFLTFGIAFAHRQVFWKQFAESFGRHKRGRDINGIM